MSRYKTRLEELENKIILLASENDHLLAVIKERDEEILSLRNRLLEAEEEQRRLIDQVREQVESSFKQRLVVYTAYSLYDRVRRLKCVLR